MYIEKIIETISTSYATLTEECKDDLKKASKILTLDKEAKIVKEGQFADKLYFVVRGGARAYYLKNGKDITDWFAFEGEFVSAIDSFFQDSPTMYTIELLEPTTLLQISRETVFALTNKHHCFEKLGRIAVTKTMLELQERVVSIQFESALQKYTNLINARPDIIQRVQLTHIASYIGVTLETLSRIRNPKYRI
ncbi:Crp/Fnr family transcriptional regulator [Flavobacterium sp. ZT3R18]|uniref:Crp/Fnr family transcriptional regulator n=1 Tax=Flavobacterium sp. ZT3R18 TaxID=2594429 RepID=UPI00117ACDA4|nr:Crp/Fnr family transcriptional regulator [Flavobacterium sp. ZT3R18]TRX35449.1 Crp/Fnr family transcriptional regulator [Flavobacterium sp. ZT3R18]